MPDPDFWRNLAEQFRALDQYGTLRASLDYIVGSGDRDHWRVAGGDYSMITDFEALARHAGRAIDPAGMRSDPLFVWLDDVHSSPGPYSDFGVETPEKNPDGSRGAIHLMHTIDHVCIASAVHCRELESELLKLAGVAPPPRALEPAPIPKSVADQAETESPETIAEQLERLRIECDWTIEVLAEMASISARTVQRHISSMTTPSARLLGKYERAFSKRLKRRVAIKKLS